VGVFVKNPAEINAAAENGKVETAEFAQRVAILRRFKILLSQQRERLNSYLEVLEKKQNTIESGSAEDLLAYVEIEEKIACDIFSIQKVIDPLEDMYRSVVYANGLPVPEGEDDVPSLKAALEELTNEAVIRSHKNKELLSKRITELRLEIKAIGNNPFAAKSSGFNNSETASLIDIQG